MTKIIVLGGGSSAEREISLLSAQGVRTALISSGFDTKQIDPRYDKRFLSGGAIVFPILHGVYGEDGGVQAEMEKASIPFLGSDSISSKNSFYKNLTRDILKAHNVSLPKGDYISFEQYSDHELSKTPHVLKIIDGGSSIGTYIQRGGKMSTKEIENNFSNSKFLIEELIEGVEITVPILDAKALPVIEIIPPQDGEFDYENKYNGQTEELCPPQNVSLGLQKEAQALAEEVHKVMGCRHLSRVDMMIDASGNLYILEINTMPGMTDQSLYPKSALEAGISMPELMKKFVDMVTRDYSLN